ncbi:MAG: type II toxin-antitoxin system RelE/ParE family toxin [Oscillospiraceae bacterium]|nr:type II toxin-antitoxin system RelE/ParE family toxin [Oscillospiraceae bacterium]
MKKYRLVYIVPARHDVANIKNYLSQFYPSTPGKFLKALKLSVEKLCDNPTLYGVYEGNSAYRKMAVLDYLVFYKVIEDDGVVEIHRVLYGMRDIKSNLP